VKTSSGRVVDQLISYEITENRIRSVFLHLKYWLKLTSPVVASTCMLISVLIEIFFVNRLIEHFFD